MVPLVKIPSYWDEVVDGIHRTKGVVIVLGASDTGKTTLACHIVGELHRRRNRVSFISADMGQCAFGPPAVISMAVPESIPKPMTDISPHSMYFTGSTSPVGHLLQTVVGVKRLVDRSVQNGAQAVVIDTTGMVAGGAAWELKFHKIELAGARSIVAIQREGELDEIIRPLERLAGCRLYRLPVCKEAKARSYEQRREYRRCRYEEYFRNARVRSLSLGGRHLINPHNKTMQKGESGAFKRLLVGLNDRENFTMALGVIEDIDLLKGRIRLLTPLTGFRDVSFIRLGSIRIGDDWSDSRV